MLFFWIGKEYKHVEIWTIKAESKKAPASWAKEKFKFYQNKRPRSITVNNFFAPKVPPLASLVMAELQRSEDRRWIVFSKEEEAKLMEISGHLLNSGSSACYLLDCVLMPVHASWAGGFATTFVREDEPNKSPFEIGAPLRLVIQIDAH